MHNCPKGCQSSDPDYCSECGAKIAGAPLASAPSVSSPTGGFEPSSSVSSAGTSSTEKCPDCGAARIPADAIFCELCRYDFRGAAANRAAVAEVVAAPAPPQSPPPAAVARPDSSAVPIPLIRWEVFVSVDRYAFQPTGNIATPEAIPERVFPLEFADLLIGRRSDVKDIHPEIPLNEDAAVSHRQAKLQRLPDGRYSVLDLGSANGTQHNGVELVPGVRTPLKPGDVLRVGRWTVLLIREQPSGHPL